MKAFAQKILVGARAWILVPLLFSAAIHFTKDLELIRYLRSAVELALGFKVRYLLGREPEVSPHLKTVVFDDKAASAVSAGMLPHKDLLLLLKEIQKKKPSLILIDHVFGFGVADEHLGEGFLSLREGEAPIGVGAVFSPQAIGDRATLDEIRPEFLPQTYGASTDIAGAEHSSDFPPRAGFLYGPHQSVISAFHKIGHLAYYDADNGYFEPLLRTSDQKVIPHLAMYGGKEVEFSGESLRVMGSKVPVQAGKTLVNFISLGQLKRRSVSMGPIFAGLAKGMKIPDRAFGPGDVVLVLPAVATGTGDLFDTPLGRMRGGHILAAELNSFMTNQWIRSVAHPGIAVFIAVLCGLALGRIANSVAFSALALGAGIFWATSALMLFSFVSLDVPWLFPTAALLITATGQHFLTVFNREINTQLFKQALHRLVSQEKVDRLAKNPTKLSLSPQEQVVSIMFLDMVGFSLTAETRSPEETFGQLRTFLGLVCDCIYEYGGMVDKILGDGALCVFGYSLDATESETDHADQAVICAVEIQRRVLAHNMTAPKGYPIFPLRIGIHSTPAFMGDLGGHGKIEFTIIGHGVNFARRLEEGCEPYRIMISAACREVLRSARHSVPMTRRDVSIKHHSKLFEAWELDAFWDNPNLLQDGLRQFSAAAGKRREEERHLIPSDIKMPAHFEPGPGNILDFSKTGVRVEVPFYVSKGTHMTMVFQQDDCPLFNELFRGLLTHLQVIVMWGRPVGPGRYFLGLQFVGLSVIQRSAFVNTLAEWTEGVANKTHKVA